MLSPGFVTDALGILLILPVTRPLFRGAAGRRTPCRQVVASYRLARPRRVSAREMATRPAPEVVQGEVVED